MNTRLYIFFTLLTGLFYSQSSSAQSCINLEAGQVFSTYKYIDSKGVVDKTYSYNNLSTYGLSYQYTAVSGLFVRAGLNMRKAGARMIYNNIDYIWTLQYADLKAGIGYQFNKWRLKPSLLVSPYYASLLDANQTINSNNYDIKANNSIKGNDFGLFIAPGITIMLSSYVSIYAEYNYIIGLHNIETNQGEQCYNRGFSLNFGVSLNITKIAKLNQPRIIR